MIRDYSDEVYNCMLKQIDEINSETINCVTDALGDVVLHMGKWTGLIRTSSTEEYQKKMLDMNDTTAKQLKKIFKEVKEIDATKSEDIKKINDRQREYNNKIKQLSDTIHPGVSFKSAEEIKKICSGINGNLTAADKAINEKYQTVLRSTTSDVVLKAVKGTIGGIVNCGVSILSLPVKMIEGLATGGPVKMATEAASDTWGIINSVFSVGSNIGALAAVGLGGVFAFATGNSRYREAGLEEAEKYVGSEGLADALIAEYGENKFTSTVKGVSDMIDTIDTLDSLIDDSKGFIKGEGILPKNPIPEHEVLQKKDMLDKYKDDYRHIQWLYNKYEKQKNNASVVKHVYDYAETIFDVNEEGGVLESLGSEMLEESKLLKDMKDIFGDDELESLRKWASIV